MKSIQSKNIIPANSNHPAFLKQETGNNFFAKNNKPFFSSSKIQTKLTVNQPNDVYEKEADATADKVVQRLNYKSFSGSENNPSHFFNKPAPFIQCKCAACEQEEKLQEKEEVVEKDLLKNKLQTKPIFESNAEPPDDGSLSFGEGRGEVLQRKCTECEKEEKLQKKFDPSPQTASSNVESSLSSSRGSGSPMPQNTREQMESSFGADFSGVKIHNDSSSVQMNKDLNAQAFTHGSDIYFNSGKYDINSTGGKHLLAHELTHTLQQQSAIKNIQRQTAPLSSTTSATSTGTPATPHVCGPDVTAKVSTVWGNIQGDFRGWAPADKLAAAFYLISPYVPEAGTNPRSSGSSTLFSGSLGEPILSILSKLPFLGPYLFAASKQWQLNRDAFDTIGLFVLSAGWTLSVPGCGQPGCAGLTPPGGLPRGYTDPCEGPGLCSFAVQMGTNCWLSGTVNYGTYGIMMKEAYDWCSTQRGRLLGLMPGILLRSLGNPRIALALLRAAMTNEEIAAAVIKELFSIQSLTVYVGGYKLWDMENPLDPVRWARATYSGGSSGIPTGTNRPLCQTTCGPLDPSIFSGWDYVWEPVKHR